MALSLDTLSATDPAVAALPRPEPAMPPESRLDMPTQSLRRWSRSQERRLAPALYRTPASPASSSSAAPLALTAYGAYEMYQVVSVSRTTILQWLLLLLFTLNFSWIALAFTSALLGFGVLLARPREPEPLPAALQGRTAVVMPVYNESTARTFAAFEAMRDSIEATGLGRHFDYFILSDSTNPDVWIAEERAFLVLRERLGPGARLYYRHRPKNHHRKAGNIADFVRRWGGAYDHMLVLDADSS
jgi:membrane glycosyltransferase